MSDLVARNPICPMEPTLQTWLASRCLERHHPCRRTIRQQVNNHCSQWYTICITCNNRSQSATKTSHRCTTFDFQAQLITDSTPHQRPLPSFQLLSPRSMPSGCSSKCGLLLPECTAAHLYSTMPARPVKRQRS